jgi:hypothetical protein
LLSYCEQIVLIFFDVFVRLRGVARHGVVILG